MTRAVPKEEREKIVQAYKKGFGTIRELAKIFDVSPRAIDKYLQLDREVGDLTPDTQPGRPPVLTEKNLSIIKKLVTANPDGTLDDYRIQFYNKTGIDVTIDTIHNACKKLDLRRKKSLFAAEQERQDVAEKRIDFIESMKDIDPADIIVLDESGSDLSQTSDYARAEGGERAKAPKPHCPGERYSIIGAVSISTIVTMMYIDCAIDGNVFLSFIEKLLLPKLRSGQYVVMDNISFHKQEMVRILIESAGAKVVFLPPYSPDLSPIEKMWSKIKNILKRKKPRTKAAFHMALFSAMAAVTEEDLEAWYEDCGYSTI